MQTIIDPQEVYTQENSLKWEEKDSNVCLFCRPAIVKKVNQLGLKSLLDLGCGTGRWTELMAQNMEKACGIDCIETMIQIAQERHSAPNITYHLADMFRLNEAFKPGQFDVVTGLLSVQYAENAARLLQLFQGVNYILKPQCHLLFLVPHPLGIMLNNSKWARYRFPAKNGYFSHLMQCIIRRIFPRACRYLPDYFSNDIFTGRIRLTDNDWKKVGANFHNVEEYVNAVIQACFKIVEIEAPKPSPELLHKFPSMANEAKIPICLLVHGIKEH